MKNTIIKRIFSIFLGTIILTTTILAASLPITDIPVYAADTKNMLTSPEVLGTDVNTDNMQIVGYAGKQWYVIGYGSNGNCAKADANGGITLFSKGSLGFNIDFNPVLNKVNTYKDSHLQNYIDNTVYGTFGVAEKVAVKTRNLEGGSGNYSTSTTPFYNSNKIAGDPVYNAAL